MNSVTDTRSIVVERRLPHPPAKVWRTLTTSELIERWLMPNTFELAVGKRFGFRATPVGGWDGIVECEIIEIDAPRRLKYSWNGSGASARNGRRLETTVTWTLTAVDGDATLLHLAHEGFRPEDQAAFDAMSHGWGARTDRYVPYRYTLVVVGTIRPVGVSYGALCRP